MQNLTQDRDVLRLSSTTKISPIENMIRWGIFIGYRLL
ncbi:hypothetical protein ADIS_1156 [Lunatimonas lonarensis]|uniref:Uncharacterized protein n=1 Tax=Lunatimonas lonarensis TaxID=1232681 RepID=R7ZWA0_9BACT|nr:hypothetical protein ADIS_1156 [Lunatimonas lonarensis]